MPGIESLACCFRRRKNTDQKVTEPSTRRVSCTSLCSQITAVFLHDDRDRLHMG